MAILYWYCSLSSSGCPGGEEGPSAQSVARQCTWQRRCWPRDKSGTNCASSAPSVARCWTGWQKKCMQGLIGRSIHLRQKTFTPLSLSIAPYKHIRKPTIWKVSFIERSIVLCPYLRGSTIGSSNDSAFLTFWFQSLCTRFCSAAIPFQNSPAP